MMRTTLEIDDDVLAAARDMASATRSTIGEVVSKLARKGLKPDMQPAKFRNGIMLIPEREGAGHATLEIVNALRDEMP
jgi:hypothetical protein